MTRDLKNKLVERIIVEGFPCVVSLDDIVGEFDLTGVDLAITKSWPKAYNPEEFEDCNAIRFVLDGVTFMAIEDPDDGYRSSMREVVVTDEPVAYRFPPIRVRGVKLGECNTGYSDRRCNMVQLVNMATGRPILRVGTDNSDDYYPSFISQWEPNGIDDRGYTYV